MHMAEIWGQGQGGGGAGRLALPSLSICASHLSLEEASDVLEMIHSIFLQPLLSLDWAEHSGEENFLCFPKVARLGRSGVFCCGLT